MYSRYRSMNGLPPNYHGVAFYGGRDGTVWETEKEKKRDVPESGVEMTLPQAPPETEPGQAARPEDEMTDGPGVPENAARYPFGAPEESGHRSYRAAPEKSRAKAAPPAPLRTFTQEDLLLIAMILLLTQNGFDVETVLILGFIFFVGMGEG